MDQRPGTMSHESQRDQQKVRGEANTFPARHTPHPRKEYLDMGALDIYPENLNLQ
jgi:hypothetical protein